MALPLNQNPMTIITMILTGGLGFKGLGFHIYIYTYICIHIDRPRIQVIVHLFFPLFCSASRTICQNPKPQSLGPKPRALGLNPNQPIEISTGVIDMYIYMYIYICVYIYTYVYITLCNPT